MVWYKLFNDDYEFLFQCPVHMNPELVACAILSQHGLTLSDFALVEVDISRSSQFCE